MGSEQENVIGSFGICSRCNEPIERQEDLAMFREKPVHKRCIPDKETIDRENKSYT